MAQIKNKAFLNDTQKRENNNTALNARTEKVSGAPAVRVKADADRVSIQAPQAVVIKPSAEMQKDKLKKSRSHEHSAVFRGFAEQMKRSAAILDKAGMKEDVDKLARILTDAARDKFTVSVIGEYSRGKSTFINRLLGRDILPVGALPVTAMPTRITRSKKEGIAIGDRGGTVVEELPLDRESWEKYVISYKGADLSKDQAIVSIDDEWLGKYGIDIIDTPGVSDFIDDRMRYIEETLIEADAVIIVTSAQQFLSESELVLIKDHILKSHTPYLMLVVTQLDLLECSEREEQIEHLINKLKNEKISLPMLIAYDIEIPGNRYGNIIGLDKVKKLLEVWAFDPERVSKTVGRAADRAVFELESRAVLLAEQKRIAQADDKERSKLILEKNEQLEAAEKIWQNIRGGMEVRRENCCRMLADKIQDSKEKICARLKHEAERSIKPQEWWEREYPFRVKAELDNLYMGAESLISTQITRDTAWLNSELGKSFRIGVTSESVKLLDKKTDEDVYGDSSLSFRNIDAQRKAVRVGTAALMIAGCMLLPVINVPTLVASYGISPVVGIIGEEFFKKEMAAQQEQISEQLDINIPAIVDEAVKGSDDKIKDIYDRLIRSAADKENEWLAMQKQALMNAEKQKSDNRDKAADMLIETYKKLIEGLKKYQARS